MIFSRSACLCSSRPQYEQRARATISEFATCAGLTREFVHKVLREDKNSRRTMFEELNKDRQETMF